MTATEAQPRRKVVFLDFDDVVVVGGPYAVFDPAGPNPPVDLHEKLFAKHCVKILRAIDEEHMPRYVITTSWLRLMQLDAIATLPRICTGIFADRLEPSGEAFPVGHETRAGAIERWLASNPGSFAFVVLAPFTAVQDSNSQKQQYGHVVLCEVGMGLQRSHIGDARKAFGQRANRTFLMHAMR